MGLKETTLSLLKDVTNSLVSVWVKGNWLDVTKYEVFFLKASLRINQERLNMIIHDLETYNFFAKERTLFFLLTKFKFKML